MKIGYKIWIENGGKAFGKGPYTILKEVQRTGSIRQAATELGMSYSKAYQTIRNCEEFLGFKLIDTMTGGKTGGGSHLTQKCIKLMSHYEEFMLQAKQQLMKLFSEHFEEFE